MKFSEIIIDWSSWGWPLLVNHLWQATLFAGLALAAVKLARRAPARARYAIWLIALIKFAVPSALIFFTARKVGINLSAITSPPSESIPLAISPILSPVATSPVVLRTNEQSLPGTTPSIESLTMVVQDTSWIYGLITLVWALGCSFLLISWLKRRRRLSLELKRSVLFTSGREVDALERVRKWFGLRREVKLVTTPAISEPGVWGIWNPVVVLPEGVPEQLSDAELETVFMHELSHIERWDNLVGNFQRALCCLFWFNPMIWLIDRRLLSDREEACDDTVLRRGGNSDAYARGIAKVCRFCLGWEVAGLAKVAGSDLKARVQRIIALEAERQISALHVALVAATFVAAVAFSIVAVDVREKRVSLASDGTAVADLRFDDRTTVKAAVVSRPSTFSTSIQADGTAVQAERIERGSKVPIEVRGYIEPIERDGETVDDLANAVSLPVPPVAEDVAPQTQPPQPPAQDAREDTIEAPIIRASSVNYADGLRRFIGRYEVDPKHVENFILDVVLDRGELWLKPSHAPRRRLVRQSETDFVDAHNEFSFTFITDDDDHIVGLRLNSWMRRVTARKLALPSPRLKGNTTFRLRGFADARVVAVAGTFNNWNQSELLLEKHGDEWVCRIDLPRGTHQYKFIVDGNWLVDPLNAKRTHDNRGHQNSVLTTD